jgi:hypothetical protein
MRYSAHYERKKLEKVVKVSLIRRSGGKGWTFIITFVRK